MKLTRKEIENLTDRELDKLVAIHVTELGKACQPDDVAPFGFSYKVYDRARLIEQCVLDDKDNPLSVPLYSSDGAKVWVVVEAMKKRGQGLRLQNVPYDRTYATFAENAFRDDYAEANGANCTFRAICMAALMMVMEVK